MVNRILAAALLGIGLHWGGAAGAEPITPEQIAAIAEPHARASLAGFRDFLSLPNDAHYPSHIAANRAWLRSAFERRGFVVSELEGEGPALQLAELDASGAQRTVLIYVHADGQPVQPDKWRQADPFEPVLKSRFEGAWHELPWSRLDGEINPDWRIFARSAADAKGPIAMLLAALDALAAQDVAPAHNLKVVVDYEEERGSPHLAATVRRHIDDLDADWLLIFDGPRHASNAPTLVFGARGIARLTLRVFGPRLPQHSGHFGNWAPNPAQRLVGLLASFEDRDGRVAIEGFYDAVELDEAAREALRRTPDDETAMLRALGVAEPERVADGYQASLQYPSLSILGLQSGWVGDQTRTAIPDSAVAELDLRLVPENDPDRLIGLIRRHIEDRGWHLVDGDGPSEAERAEHPRLAALDSTIHYGAFRTPMDSDIGGYLADAMTRAFGSEPVRIRILGGSVPISPFINELDLPAVIVPAANADNNQHSPNENLRVGNYFEGVRQYLSILLPADYEPD